MRTIRKCVVCGKAYEATYNSKYCGVECRQIMNSELQKKWREEKAKPKKPRKKKETVVDIAAKAKEMGLTYGQYVARMEYGK